MKPIVRAEDVDYEVRRLATALRDDLRAVNVQRETLFEDDEKNDQFRGDLRANKTEGLRGLREWSGREDSNLRLLGPEPSALPGCATPRKAGLAL